MKRVVMCVSVLMVLPITAAAQTPPPPPTRPPGQQQTAPPGQYRDATWEYAARLSELGDRGWAQSDFVGQFVWANDDYSAGLSLLTRRQYEDAIERFARTIDDADDHVDGALYWKAFSEYKLGLVDRAKVSLDQLRRDFTDSRYLNDARVLEADVARLAGDPVDPEAVAAMDDDEIKLLAITGIQRSDPEGAIPLLEGVLGASNSLAVKKRALYVLALSSQPRAVTLLLDYAKGAGNPDLQVEAIRYVATTHDADTRSVNLRQIYESTEDTIVRRAVIDAYRPAGAWFPVLTSRLAPPRRGSFVTLRAPRDLLRLYELEENPDLRLRIVVMFEGLRAVEQIHEVLRTEEHPAVLVRAVRSLGGRDSTETGVTLVNLYGDEESSDVRRAVIRALGTQRNAEGLVSLARAERDLALRTEIVRRLSELAGESKVAADYLMEIIK